MTSTKLRRNPVSLGLSLGMLATLAVFGACDSSNTGPANSCPVGEKRCACYSNKTCNDGLVCLSDTCVEPINSSTGGTVGTTANAGTQAPQATGGNGQVATNTATVPNTGGSGSDTAQTGVGGSENPATTAGSNGGATQASVTSGSSTPSTGGATQASATSSSNPASGGTSNPATTTTPSTGGMTQATVGTTSSVNNSPIIDAFATCDDQIESNGGRSGKWYYFADSDFNATHAFGDPGTKWIDHGCAAWMILGCTGTACTFAGLGVQLSGGNPVDLSSYAGVSIALEAGNDVYFVVKTSDGGYFGKWITATTGNQTRNLDFSDLDAMTNSAVTTLNESLITEMQFTIGKTIEPDAGFGMAIHAVSLR